MPAISNIIVSNAPSEPIFEGGGHRRPLTLKRHPRTRSFRLRVDPRDGRVLLSLPQRSSLVQARKWAESERDWIEARLAQLPLPRPVEPGGTIPYRGREIRIDWSSDYPHKPVLRGDLLRLGGSEDAVARRTLRWLEEEARSILGEETGRYALRGGRDFASERW